MIVTANENYINVIMNLSAEDPFACRIISQYNSYDSSLAFVDYWTIIDDKTDECTGAISRCGTNFILFLTDKTNLEEVSSFMRVAGASSAICSRDFNLNLYGSKSVSGVILKKSEPFENVDESINFDVPDIKEVYNLIVSCADENFVPPPFDEDFYGHVDHTSFVILPLRMYPGYWRYKTCYNWLSVGCQMITVPCWVRYRVIPTTESTATVQLL